MSNNDSTIIEMRKQIEEKEKKLETSKKFSPITNCSVNLDGVQYNLNTLDIQQIIGLMVKMYALNMAAKELGLEYKISGFLVDDWLTDLKAKKDYLNRKEEEQKLKSLKTRLQAMLSEDKKIELEIEEIKKFLS